MCSHGSERLHLVDLVYLAVKLICLMWSFRLCVPVCLYAHNVCSSFIIHVIFAITDRLGCLIAFGLCDALNCNTDLPCVVILSVCLSFHHNLPFGLLNCKTELVFYHYFHPFGLFGILC